MYYLRKLVSSWKLKYPAHSLSFCSIAIVFVFCLSVFYKIIFSTNEQLISIWRELSSHRVLFTPAILSIFSVIYVLNIRSTRVSSGLEKYFVATFSLAPPIFLFFKYIGDGHSYFAFQSFVFILASIAAISSIENWQRHREFLMVASNVLFLLVLLGLFYLFEWYPVETAKHLGPASLILMFVASLVMVSIYFLRFPIIRFPILAFAVYGLAFNSISHETKPKATNNELQRDVTEQQAFAKWLSSRNDLGFYAARKRPYPVFIVSSEGGGGYAAAHAHMLLSSIQSKCQNFAQHVFALVGVSGGAVGNALFHNQLGTEKDQINPKGHRGCGKEPKTANLKFHFIDHLSPIVGAFLFNEIPKKFVPFIQSGNDRRQALQKSFSSDPESGISKANFWDHYWLEAGPSGSLNVANGKPALVQIATDVVTGRIYSFAPFRISELPGNHYSDDFSEHYRQDISILDATVASATFPYVTPTTELFFSLDENNKKHRLLVDGGYTDNSGFSSSFATVNHLKSGITNGYKIDGSDEYESLSANLSKVIDREIGIDSQDCKITLAKSWLERTKWDNCDIPVFFTQIVIRSETSNVSQTDTTSNFFLDPLLTLLSSRSARSELDLMKFEGVECDVFECVKSNPSSKLELIQSVIEPNSLNMPLGWSMPKFSIAALENALFEHRQACVDAKKDEYGKLVTQCSSIDLVRSALTAAKF